MSHLPTKDWRWPTFEVKVTAHGGTGTMTCDPPLRVEEPPSYDELAQALGTALAVVDRLVRWVPEYHGSPLEESVDDDMRPAHDLLARIRRTG